MKKRIQKNQEKNMLLLAGLRWPAFFSGLRAFRFVVMLGIKVFINYNVDLMAAFEYRAKARQNRGQFWVNDFCLEVH